MITKESRFYAIDASMLRSGALVLDMLRYDQARVVGNHQHPGYWVFVCDGGPDVERWASYGFSIAAIAIHEHELGALIEAWEKEEPQ